MTFLIASGVILLLIFLGMSIPYTFMAGSTLFCIIEGAKMNWFPSTGYYSMESYSMLAMPLFIAAGSLLERSGIASRLVDLGEIMLRKVKGGLAATIPVVSAFFGALSGSGLATASTMCTMLGPRLFEKGWDRRYVAAFVAASAPLGFLIPPNVNAVVYSMVSECSIASLFIATVIPAILLLAFYLIINRIVYTKWYHPGVNYNGENAEAVIDTSEAMTLWQAVKRSLLAFLMPVIILGGIYSGVFTATEAGAISCFYGLLIGCFVYKSLKAKDVFAVFRDSAYSVATMMMIFPFTFIFSRVMVTNGVPQIITEFITSISTNPYVITLLLAVILIIAGCFLDANILLLVFTPLLLPTAASIGISSLQFGVIVFMAVGIGAATPPMAMCLFLSARLCRVSVNETVRPLLPFLLFGALPVLLLVSYVPALSEWLPSLLN
ncbi:MAG: TRAP transporter large permease [Oscillibacter sp.]|nr:TRAP transporter large permease [Oscillibacter sp.]